MPISLSEGVREALLKLLPHLLIEDLDEADRICSICSNPYRYQPVGDLRNEAPFPLQLPCSHIFCGDCVRRWYKSSSTCPICRADIASNLSSLDSQTINLEGDLFTLDEILSFPLRFSPEFRRILRDERPVMTEQERIIAERERSWGSYVIWRDGDNDFRPGDDLVPETDYEAFVEIFDNYGFVDIHCPVEAEFDVYNWLQYNGFFKNAGFSIIRQASGRSDLEIYAELMLAGVRMNLRGERWVVSGSNHNFFPLRLEYPYRRGTFRFSEPVEGEDRESDPSEPSYSFLRMLSGAEDIESSEESDVSGSSEDSEMEE